MPWRKAPTNFIRFGGSVYWDPKFRLPATDFPFEAEILFTELHERFNTVPFFIQEPESWHLDVCEALRDADEEKDLYDRLEKKKQQRLAELKQGMERLSYSGKCDKIFRNNWTPEQYTAFEHLFGNASYDTMFKFITTFLGTDQSDLVKPERGSRWDYEDLIKAIELAVVPARAYTVFPTRPEEESGRPEASSRETNHARSGNRAIPDDNSCSPSPLSSTSSPKRKGKEVTPKRAVSKTKDAWTQTKSKTGHIKGEAKLRGRSRSYRLKAKKKTQRSLANESTKNSGDAARDGEMRAHIRSVRGD